MFKTASFVSNPHQYALLRIYAYYRAILALLLLTMFNLSIEPFAHIIGARQPTLFNYIAWLYLIITLITLVRLQGMQFKHSDQHIFLVCLVDITCLTLLIYASGGLNSGLGLLLLITVSAASIILASQIATLVAAMATIAILASVISEVLSTQRQIDILLPAGLLGFMLFGSSRLFLYLTKRIQLSVEEAELQAQRRVEAQQLNELIVRRMRTGLIVLAANGQIRLMNESAARLLNLPLAIDTDTTIDISFTEIPVLHECFQQWRKSPQVRIQPIQLPNGGPELQLRFAGLDQSANTDVLVFVEDAREISQQAQQLKLVSLGHLTANIAHEVRNPLGAISHAAQLLAESKTVDENDYRLSEIIQTHSNRVNQIIENVLQLSRRNQAQPQRNSLKSFLENFAQHYKQSHRESIDIEIQCDSPDIIVNIDASQMEQVLNNLCDNGLRYSQEATGSAHILLHAYINSSLENPCLDIIDDGSGISEERANKIFEPFFTTEKQGTGLGLYIAQEICIANQAQLDYRITDEGKSCFYINFSHSDKSNF